MFNLNNCYIANKYLHHNKIFVAFCFENCVNILNINNKEKIHVDKLYLQISEHTRYLFVSNYRFVFIDKLPNKIYHCKIIDNKVKILKDFDFTNLLNIEVIFLFKIKDEIILISYIDKDDRKKLYITEINLQDYKNNARFFSIKNILDCDVRFAKKYIYIFSPQTQKNDTIFRYNIMSNKGKKITIHLNNYNSVQFGKRIYFISNNSENTQIYDIKQNLIETINDKDIFLIYISKIYTVYLNVNNNKITIKNKINNIENYKIIDFYHNSIAVDKTIITDDSIIMQVNFNRMMTLNLNTFKKNSISTNIGNIYIYHNYVYNSCNKNIKLNDFNPFLHNYIIYNKKIVGTIIYGTNSNSNLFNTNYLKISSNNKFKIFKSKYNNMIQNEYTSNGQNIIRVSDLYVKEANYLKKLAFDKIDINDYSIIMPIYFTNGKISDSQALISGKILNGEDPLVTVQREIYEETGIYIKKNIIKYANEFIDDNTNKKQFLYYVYITSKNDVDFKNKFITSDNKDTKNKIYVLVLGKTDILEEIMDMIDFRPPAPDNDGSRDSYIGGVRMINVIDLF